MKFTVVLFLFILAGCAAQNSYVQYRKAATVPGAELLQPGQQPNIIFTADFETAGQRVQEKKYIAIGASSFDGDPENTDNILKHASREGATLVLVKKELTHKFENNKRITRGYPLRENRPAAALEFPDEAHGGNALPYPESPQWQYKQSAVYFVKSNQKLKFGIQLVDLASYQRSALKRHKGAVINVVFENSPAAAADIKRGSRRVLKYNINNCPLMPF